MQALVVDDSRAMRSIIGRVLKELGFAVNEAGNGQEAIEKLGAVPDTKVALVDWDMPVMNGLDFVKAVRADQRYAGLTLVMCTTESEAIQVSRALEAGANEYVMKPFTADILKEKLAMVGVSVPGVNA